MKIQTLAVLISICSTAARGEFVYHDSATTDGGSFNSSFPIESLKNAGHRLPTRLESADASNESYATTSPPKKGYPVTVTLDFDSATALEKFYLWNHSNKGASGAPANGVGSFSLAFYDAPGGGGGQVGPIFNGNAAVAPATGKYAAEVFDFGRTYERVRSVVFTIKSKQGGTTSGFVAVREIGFESSKVSTPSATSDKVIVYLVGGQSNADGYGRASELSKELKGTQPDIDFYQGNGGGSSPLAANQWIRLQPGSGSMSGNAGGFGPELSFGIGIRDTLGSEGARIAVIKHTRGGTSLHTDWIPGGNASTSGDGPDYRAFQTTVKNGLDALAVLYPDATIQLEGMIWHQGEADAGSPKHAGDYKANLKKLITDVRATVSAPELKFGIVQLSNNQTSLNEKGRDTVKAAQLAVADADANNYLVTTDDLPMAKGSSIHFGTQGVLQIGTRLSVGMGQVPVKNVGADGLDGD